MWPTSPPMPKPPRTSSPSITRPPPTPVPTVTISRSSTSSPAPKVNSPHAAALASFSTTTGSSSSSSRKRFNGSSRQARFGAKTHHRASLVDEAGGRDADRLDGLGAGEAAHQLADRPHDLLRVGGRRLGRARARRPARARRRAQPRSWCRRRRRRPCSSRFLVPAGAVVGVVEVDLLHRRGGGRARVGREQPGRGVHQGARRHRQVLAHLGLVERTTWMAWQTGQ